MCRHPALQRHWSPKLQACRHHSSIFNVLCCCVVENHFDLEDRLNEIVFCNFLFSSCQQRLEIYIHGIEYLQVILAAEVKSRCCARWQLWRLFGMFPDSALHTVLFGCYQCGITRRCHKPRESTLLCLCVPCSDTGRCPTPISEILIFHLSGTWVVEYSCGVEAPFLLHFMAENSCSALPFCSKNTSFDSWQAIYGRSPVALVGCLCVTVDSSFSQVCSTA